MIEFEKYQHVTRLGSVETEGLLDGVCYVFPKLDGTNASVWYDECVIHCGSRNRELSIDNDNAGFMNWAVTQKNIQRLFNKHPSWRLYGEWLVPHSLKTYREDAWRRFYIFDIIDTEFDETLSYEAYKPILDTYGFDYVPPLAIIKNPNIDDIYRLLDKTGFMIKDGEGAGEGLVVKNYDYLNKFGRQTWGKLVTNEFKELNHKEFGPPLINGSLLVEEEIVRDFLTTAFIEKEIAKVVLSRGKEEFDNSMIPEILGRVFYEFITEETYNFTKKMKNPTVNFRLLQNLVYKEVKNVLGI